MFGTVMTSPYRRTPGRPEATSHDQIEQAAFTLFAERGFDRTTMSDIAERSGVARRTLFRYYPSKNDLPWGQFGDTLDTFRDLLGSTPADVPLRDGVHRAVVAFNDFPRDADPPHRERMRLILRTPALEAHSVLRYASWRAVIASFVAERTDDVPTGLLPTTVGHVSLALARTAYDVWLGDDNASGDDLLIALDDAMTGLRTYLA